MKSVCLRFFYLLYNGINVDNFKAKSVVKIYSILELKTNLT